MRRSSATGEVIDVRRNYWNNLPFRVKLVLFGGIVSAAALVLTGTVLMTYEVRSFRKHFLQQIIAVADVTSQTCASSLAFDDAEFADRVLRGLDAESSVDAACIYAADGAVFATFIRPGTEYEFAPAAALAEHEFTATHLTVARPVTFAAQRVGTVFLRADLAELGERIRIIVVALLVLVAVALALSLVLALVLQRGLTRPITELQTTADRVTLERNYALRAEHFGSDELGRLTDSFNEMLAEIQRRDLALRDSESRYTQLLGRIDEVVFRLGMPDGKLKFCSPGARSLFGHSADALVSDSELFPSLIHADSRPAFVSFVAGAAAGDVPPAIEYRVTAPDGSDRWIVQTNYPTRGDGGELECIEGCFYDITDRVLADRDRDELRTKLAQSHRLEALGTLTGGIAHDFNNILSAIMGNASLALDDLDGHHALAEYLRPILQASTRARKLTRQILAFSRQSGRELVSVDLSDILDETLTLLRASLPATISIKIRVPETMPPVLADPTQMHQVIMNLCTNAQHAMQERGGLLEIGIQERELDDESVQKYPELQPGRYLELSIADSGVGIRGAHLERIFEPFFTTKPEGEGTGMGLAVVYGVVRDHGGTISVQSDVGSGTTFRILLPTLTASDTLAQPESDELFSGQGHVMFVDDEEALTRLARIMLKRLGYEPVCFTNPYLALAAFEEAPDRFDLLITDFTMPNLTGLELTERILAMRPDLPVVLNTGNQDRIDLGRVAELPTVTVADKPFDLQKLARLAHESLRGRQRPC